MLRLELWLFFAMSKANPLAGLIANYGDSDEDSDDEVRAPPLPPESDSRKAHMPPLPGQMAPLPGQYSSTTANASAAVHPAPIPHCRKCFLHSLLF